MPRATLRRATLAMLAALPLLAPLLVAPCPAAADEIAVRSARLEAAEDGYELDADFEVDLTARLEDALHKGVTLYFVVEFECTRPRWYWLDERVGAASRTTRLSFHALTRTYRLSSGSLHQTFPTLGEALRALGTVRSWTVIEGGRLAPDTAYAAAARLRLDVTQLPKPFQLSALANPEWTLVSPWQRWGFTTPAVNGGEPSR
jgi:hypothetical protein